MSELSYTHETLRSLDTNSSLHCADAKWTLNSFTQCKDSVHSQHETSQKYGSLHDAECNDDSDTCLSQPLLAGNKAVMSVDNEYASRPAALIYPLMNGDIRSLAVAECVQQHELDREETDDAKSLQPLLPATVCGALCDFPDLSRPCDGETKEITDKSSLSRHSTDRSLVADELEVIKTYDTPVNDDDANAMFKCCDDCRERRATSISSNENGVKDEVAKLHVLPEKQCRSTEDAELPQHDQIDNTAIRLNGSNEPEISASLEGGHFLGGPVENLSDSCNSCAAAASRPVETSGALRPYGEPNVSESELERFIAASSDAKDQLFTADFDIAEVGGSNVSLFIESFESEIRDELSDDEYAYYIHNESIQSDGVATDESLAHDRIHSSLAYEHLGFPVAEQSELS
jgi:hypothetical protein